MMTFPFSQTAVCCSLDHWGQCVNTTCHGNRATSNPAWKQRCGIGTSRHGWTIGPQTQRCESHERIGRAHDLCIDLELSNSCAEHFFLFVSLIFTQSWGQPFGVEHDLLQDWHMFSDVSMVMGSPWWPWRRNHDTRELSVRTSFVQWRWWNCVSTKFKFVLGPLLTSHG